MVWILFIQIKLPKKIEEQIKPLAIITFFSYLSPKYPNTKVKIDLKAT